MPEDSQSMKRIRDFSMYNQEFQRPGKDDLSTSPRPKTMQSIIIVRYIHSAENNISQTKQRSILPEVQPRPSMVLSVLEEYRWRTQHSKRWLDQTTK